MKTIQLGRQKVSAYEDGAQVTEEKDSYSQNSWVGNTHTTAINLTIQLPTGVGSLGTLAEQRNCLFMTEAWATTME